MEFWIDSLKIECLKWFMEINTYFTFIYMNQYNNKQHLHKFDYYLPNNIHQIKTDN